MLPLPHGLFTIPDPLQWKALSEEEQAIYHRMADEDRARYNEECRVSRLSYSH